MIKTTGTAVNDCNEDFMSLLLAELADASIGICLLITMLILLLLLLVLLVRT